MLSAAQRQEILFKEANEKLASNFYRHSDDIGQNTQIILMKFIVKIILVRLLKLLNVLKKHIIYLIN